MLSPAEQVEAVRIRWERGYPTTTDAALDVCRLLMLLAEVSDWLEDERDMAAAGRVNDRYKLAVEVLKKIGGCNDKLPRKTE